MAAASCPYERIKQGQLLEIQDEHGDPRKFWVCRVLQNIGGRLCLHYLNGFGIETGLPKISWEFYLNERIHPVGTALNVENRKKYGWKYAPPEGVYTFLQFSFIWCILYFVT